MKKERIFTWGALIILIMLCSYPLFLNLGRLSLRMWDESRNAINAYEMLNDHSFIVTHFNGQPDNWNSKPPLLIWVMAFFMKLFGPTMLAVRLPSALAALAISVFCFWLGKRQLNSRLPGFIAGLVLSSSVGFVDYHAARNGDFDAMLSMWMFLYVMLFFVYLQTAKQKHLILFTICLTFGILTKGIAACMMLPALLLFVLLFKQYRPFFKQRSFYLIPITGLVVGLSYYFLRELLSPGYLSSVIENEITGRYLATNEGHLAPWYFYFQLMYEAHYRIWIWCIPIAFVVTQFLAKDKKTKQMNVLLLIATGVYLLVISYSETKLPWYDAPLYPLFAMTIGLGGWTLFLFIMSRLKWTNMYERTLAFSFFCLVIFFYPAKNIMATSIRAKKETTYPELFYGDFMNVVRRQFTDIRSFLIISEDYNPHLLFYVKTMADKGVKIDVVPRNSELKVNDIVMICEPEKMWPLCSAARYSDTLYSEDGNKFLLKIKDPKDKKISPEEALFYSQIDDIKSNEKWMKDLQRKAHEKKRDFTKQIMIDALYKLEVDNLLRKPAADSIRIRFKLLDS